MSDEAQPEPEVQFRGTGLYVSLVAIGLLVVALLALALQNTDSVRFEFLWWEMEIPLFGLIIAAALVTVVIDELVGLVWRRRRRRHLSDRLELDRLRRQAKQRVSDQEGVAGPVSTGDDDSGETDSA